VCGPCAAHRAGGSRLSVARHELMPSTDEQLLAAHREWIGYVQPVGLVVAPTALLSAQAVLDRNVTDAQARLRAVLRPLPMDGDEALVGVPSLRELLHQVLDWQAIDIV